MEKRKLSPLMICHLGVMALLVVVCLVHLVMFLSGNLTPTIAQYYEERSVSINLYMINFVFYILSLVFGMLYLVKGYTKQAAVYYKVFLTMNAIPHFIEAYSSTIYPGFSIGTVVRIVQGILLLVLAFGKDLGRTNSWILFCVLLVCEVLYSQFIIGPRGHFMVTMALTLINLMLLGTVGVAIKGKYDDKDARGTY